MGVAPDQPARKSLGIGIEQQLVGVEAVTVLRLVRTIDAVAVELSRRDVVQIAVPDVLGPLRQFDPLDLPSALAIEQAELDLFGIGGKQGKIGPSSVPGCSETGVASCSQAHCVRLPGREIPLPWAGG